LSRPTSWRKLPDSFQEGQDLDVADGAPDLDDHDVDGVGGHFWMRSLISSVTCGMTWTVLPR